MKDYEVLLREFAEGKPTALDPSAVADQIRLLKNALLWLMKSGIHSPTSKEPYEFIKNVLNHIERGEKLKPEIERHVKI